jgi:hypothetical protein
VENTGRLDAVLPLTAADAPRAQLLFETMERFFEPLATCHVVARVDELAAIRRAVPRGRYQLVAEPDLAPELGYHRAAAALRSRLRIVGPPIHGWYVQQLLKLAAADVVDTPFYLTLDADVLCVRPTTFDDLVRDGRALVQTTPPNHPEWNDDAERVLGLPRSGRQYAVTPALLNRFAVAELAAHLTRRVDPRLRRLAARVPQPTARAVLASWRSFLLRQLPWTEYALYHTFLERTGRFDRYHELAGEDAIYGNCVWMESQFEDWDPGQRGRYCFSVVQSATRIPPALVRERLESGLGSPRTDAA